MTGHEIIEVLVVVNGHDSMPQTPRRVLLSIGSLKGADAQAIAQQQFLVERGFCSVSKHSCRLPGGGLVCVTYRIFAFAVIGQSQSP